MFSVAPAKYMKDIIDELSSGKIPEITQFIWVGVGIVMVFVLKGLFFFGQNYLMSSLGLKLIRDLRDQLFEKIVRLPLSFFNRTSPGDLISRFTTDLNILSEAVTIGITGPMRDLPQIVLLLWLMFERSWQLSLLTFGLIPFVYFLIRRFGQQNSEVTTMRLQKFSDLTQLLGEAISGIRVVKAFNMEAYELGRFNRENSKLYHYFQRSIRIDSYSYPILELLGSFFGAAILTYGGYLIIHGQMTGGDFASFLISFFMLYEPIKKFNGFILKIQEGISAGERIFQIIDGETAIIERPNAVTINPLQNEIHIQIKDFRYDEKPVLQNIDLHLKKGTITALVGASGSGKTTLVNLIPRFYELAEDQGSIFFDGVDCRDIQISSLRREMAIVTQEIVLFNAKIRQNISYGKSGSTLNEVIEASKAGQAYEFINKLPHQFNEEIGEKGVLLSGGQRQRLSISRALIKNASLLILDEATSALDTESEQEVQLAIDNLMKDRTSIVIAHRLSTIQNADQIHVLKEGQIVESGTHRELLETGGEYQKLYKMQFSTTEPPEET